MKQKPLKLRRLKMITMVLLIYLLFVWISCETNIITVNKVAKLMNYNEENMNNDSKKNKDTKNNTVSMPNNGNKFSKAKPLFKNPD